MEVSCEHVLRLLEADPPRLVLIDCREPDEYAFNKLPGAVLLPLGELAARADEVEDLANERADRLATESAADDRSSDADDAEPEVVVYCHHGVRSLKAASLLRAAGVNGAVSMAGGIDRWSVAIDPAVPRY
jgi:rhodanese-related sulfurtransferase